MKWFKHFNSAHDIYDLTKVRMIYGANGFVGGKLLIDNPILISCIKKGLAA